jgi:predicted nucleic acid-binding protein
MTESKVIDAWALLAWLRNEQPAADHVRDCLQRAEEGNLQLFMSWINAGEVYYMLSRKHNAKIAEEFLARLPSMPIRVVLPDEEDIIAAAKLKSARKISYADGFAAALAAKESAALITGDPELRDMADVLTIEWIGPQSAG